MSPLRHSLHRRWLALLVGMSMLSPPALGVPLVLGPDDDDLAPARARLEDRLAELGTSPEQSREAVAALTADDLAVLDAHPAMVRRAGSLSDARTEVAAGLEDAGYDTQPAAALASCLTPDDVRVLQAHPAMLQRAGTWSQATWAYIIGALIVAGIIALAASSNSSGAVVLTSP